MLAGLVVADDLTGACDTGHKFAARGYRTRVSLDSTAERTDTDVLVVDTDSRYAPTDAAAADVRSVVDAHPAETVYKKVDSTLRGNFAAEVTAALREHVEGRLEDSTPDDPDAGGLAVVAPAAPATGRTTACGVHLVEGVPVTNTEPGRDTESGPASPRLPDLFANTTFPVERLGIGTVAAGPETVADRLRSRSDGLRIVTADATHERHLRALAAGVDRLDEPAVYVGSAGLAGHVPVSASSDGSSTAARPAPSGDETGVLAVAGSTAPQTLAALEALPERSLVTVDADAAVADPARVAGEAATRARKLLTAENRVVLTAAAENAAVGRALAAGRRAGLADREIRDRVAETLAETAARVVVETPPAGLFLTGGDTAVAVLEALDGEAISLSGETVEAGIPLGTVEGGRADGATLVTKAGAFGDRETVINCLDHLQSV